MNAPNEQPLPQPSQDAIALQAATAPPVVVSAAQALDELVRWKYRYLLADLNADVFAQEQLRRLLLEHEEAVELIATANRRGQDAATLAELNALLAEIDDLLHQSLDWARYEQFESLKHSEAQQRQLAEYLGGISNVAPIDAQSERAILEAKLHYKKVYETALLESGIGRKTLSVAERQYAHTTVANALNEYRDNFLIEARSLLSDEQYTALSDYETTEFQRMLAELQTVINSK